MKTGFVILACALALLFLGLTFHLALAKPDQQPGSPIAYIHAESGEEVEFHAHNDADEPGRSIPQLILYHNDGLNANRRERTLIVEVSGVHVVYSLIRRIADSLTR